MLDIVAQTVYRQKVDLLAGWGLYSTFISPIDANIETVFSDVVSDIIIIKSETGDVYWRLKKEYKHTPSLSTYYSEEGYWRGSAYAVKTMTLGNDGTPWLKNKNDPKNKNQVMWETKHREIKDKCGSYEVLPVLPQDVPNFLGLPNSTPAKNIPAQKTPANVAAQDTSTTLNNTSMTTLSHQVQPIEPTAPTTNWPLIIAVAVGVYLFSA